MRGLLAACEIPQQSRCALGIASTVALINRAANRAPHTLAERIGGVTFSVGSRSAVAESHAALRQPRAQTVFAQHREPALAKLSQEAPVASGAGGRVDDATASAESVGSVVIDDQRQTGVRPAPPVNGLKKLAKLDLPGAADTARRSRCQL